MSISKWFPMSITFSSQVVVAVDVKPDYGTKNCLVPISVALQFGIEPT